jgi:hypothetical protein
MALPWRSARIRPGRRKGDRRSRFSGNGRSTTALDDLLGICCWVAGGRSSSSGPGGGTRSVRARRLLLYVLCSQKSSYPSGNNEVPLLRAATRLLHARLNASRVALDRSNARSKRDIRIGWTVTARGHVYVTRD